MSEVFLLSPAYCGGRRATFLMRPGSTLALAGKLTEGTLTLGEAFEFMSGLYFRGKLAYANRFAPDAIYIITPTRGLMPPASIVTADLLREFAAVDVQSDDQRYREPLDRSLKRLARVLPHDQRLVLLGSIATGKYVEALTAVFGERLHYPVDFIGRGDMSRGGLMLRSVASGLELEYAPLVPHVSRRGNRPPKLAPMSAAAKEAIRLVRPL
jgi:hypothetical protein